jgi:hypothetical protein
MSNGYASLTGGVPLVRLSIQHLEIKALFLDQRHEAPRRRAEAPPGPSREFSASGVTIRVR